jgi:hypothetical protein
VPDARKKNTRIYFVFRVLLARRAHRLKKKSLAECHFQDYKKIHVQSKAACGMDLRKDWGHIPQSLLPSSCNCVTGTQALLLLGSTVDKNRVSRL